MSTNCLEGYFNQFREDEVVEIVERYITNSDKVTHSSEKVKTDVKSFLKREIAKEDVTIDDIRTAYYVGYPSDEEYGDVFRFDELTIDMLDKILKYGINKMIKDAAVFQTRGKTDDKHVRTNRFKALANMSKHKDRYVGKKIIQTPVPNGMTKQAWGNLLRQFTIRDGSGVILEFIDAKPYSRIAKVL
jgi:hypothetical protein